MKTMNLIQKRELPQIAEAIKNAVNKYGDIDDVPCSAWHEEFGLSKETADKVNAIISGMDVFSPSIASVMRELGEFSE